MAGEEFDGMTQQLALACVSVRELLTPVEEAARGYRDWLTQEPRNWSAQSADAMGLAYFGYVMDQLSAMARKG
jgi:hypothetical protein